MKKSTAGIIAIVTLIIGIIIGFGAGAKASYLRDGFKPGEWQMQAQNGPGMNGGAGMNAGTAMHRMPNGQMMPNSGMGGMNMTDMMTQMTASLSGKTGDDFDKTFLREMIVHHQGAVEMAKLALTNANHQEIKTLANAIITAQNKEIADMKMWLKNWYGLTGPQRQ